MQTNETQLLDQGSRMALNAGGEAMKASGGLLSGLFSAPFAMLGNIGRGAWNSLKSTGPILALVTAASGLIAPDLWRGAGELLGRTDLSDKAADKVEKGGLPQLALISAGVGAAGATALGAASGVWQSLTGGGPESDVPTSTSARVGSTIGSVVTFGAIAAVTIGALKNSGVSHDTTASADEVKAPVAPKAQTQQTLNA